ncbi:MAG: cytochrome bc complex cytochrome b subunit [Acidobacteriota bacterium]
MAKSNRTLLDRVVGFIEERIDLSAMRHLVQEKQVPRHRHSFWYYFGGMALFLFGIQVATGVLLLLYYRPSPAEAFESVQFIMTEVEFGWLIRSMHAWAANLLVAVLFVHMFSAFLMKAYRKPREITWMSGMVLFGLMLGFGFSGYLLPWNELAFFATKVGTAMAAAVPVVGEFTLRLTRGGDEVTGATLSRFYGLHVAVLPALTALVMGLHLMLVQKQGMSVPPSVERRHGGKVPVLRFVPDFLLRDLVGWLAALAVLAALAAFFPWELGEKVDPFQPVPAGTKPEWFFLFMYQALKFLPPHFFGLEWLEGEVVGVVGLGLIGVLWLLTPFLDRKSSQGERSPEFTAIGVIAIIFIVIMTILGWVLA